MPASRSKSIRSQKPWTMLNTIMDTAKDKKTRYYVYQARAGSEGLIYMWVRTSFHMRKKEAWFSHIGRRADTLPFVKMEWGDVQGSVGNFDIPEDVISTYHFLPDVTKNKSLLRKELESMSFRDKDETRVWVGRLVWKETTARPSPARRGSTPRSSPSRTVTSRGRRTS